MTASVSYTHLYVYADEDIRKKRFMERGKSESEFRVRSDAENEQFSTYEDEHGYDIIIFNNGNIEDAVDIMESYVKLIIKDRLCLLYTSFTFFHTSGIDNLCRLTSGECIINNTGCPL